MFPENSTENFGECWEGRCQSALECDDITSCANHTLVLRCVCMFQGMSEPAPFSDELVAAKTPYVRVSMEEARHGTPGA